MRFGDVSTVVAISLIGLCPWQGEPIEDASEAPVAASTAALKARRAQPVNDVVLGRPC